MIELNNISKRYGQVQALSDVSLRVREGSIVGLLGQNGAGKTTLLNIMTGYLAATEGQAQIGGYDPLLEPEEAKRYLGYLPEHPPLYGEMTVQEYLCFVSRLKGVGRIEVLAHVGEIMERTGLSDMRRRLLFHLSKGYRQRVGMAQALCGNPRILILDEPTVGLDPKQIIEIRALIRSFAQDRTIVFSSHILSEVQQLCDHVVILHQGRVKLDAPMAELHSGEDISLLCTVAAPKDVLLPALHGLEGVKRVSPQASAAEGETAVLLTFGREAEPERALFTLLSSMQLPILHLSRCQNTLEQIFLQTIAEA